MSELIKKLSDALYQYEHAVDAVNATAESDDPHASTLALIEYNRAAEVLKTWSQPEYLRQLLDALASAPSVKRQHLTNEQIDDAIGDERCELMDYLYQYGVGGERVQELIREIARAALHSTSKRNPLTDEELWELKEKHLWKSYTVLESVEQDDGLPGCYKKVKRGYDDFIGFARAIEAAHCIQTTGGDHD